jgi:hypothetical protein
VKLPSKVIVRDVPQTVVAAFSGEPYDLGRRGHQICFTLLTEEGQWDRASVCPIGGEPVWVCTYEGEKIPWRFTPFSELGEGLEAHTRTLLQLNFAPMAFEQKGA